MQAIPTLPVEADRTTLEDGDEREDDEGGQVKDNGAPNNASDCCAWEDAQIENEDAEFDEKELGEVYYLVDIKELRCSGTAVNSTRSSAEGG